MIFQGIKADLAAYKARGKLGANLRHCRKLSPEAVARGREHSAITWMALVREAYADLLPLVDPGPFRRFLGASNGLLGVGAHCSTSSSFNARQYAVHLASSHAPSATASPATRRCPNLSSVFMAC